MREEKEGKKEEEEVVGCMEEACAWGGSVIGSLGGCQAKSEDVEIDGKWQTIEVILDSECRPSTE